MNVPIPAEHAFNVAVSFAKVRDPAAVGARVSLVNDQPVCLFVQAITRAAVEPFAAMPQQSDDVSARAGDPPRRA